MYAMQQHTLRSATNTGHLRGETLEEAPEPGRSPTRLAGIEGVLNSRYRGQKDDFEKKLEDELGANIAARGRDEIKRVLGEQALAFIDRALGATTNILHKAAQRLKPPLNRETRRVLKDFVGIESRKGHNLESVADHMRELFEAIHDVAASHRSGAIHADQIGVFGGPPTDSLAITATPADEQKYGVKVLNRIFLLPAFFSVSLGEATFTLIHEMSHLELGTLDLKYFNLGGANQKITLEKRLEENYALHRRIARAKGEKELRQLLVTSSLDLTRSAHETLFARKLAGATGIEHKAGLFLGNADTLSLVAFQLGHS